ncbi:hypothetical protein [Glaciihabitans sp. dw_435]|uniref:hypothetical protein n=1 Tax=Glaciihabitans sp. dw_435 TaxID=2720081 RepID=UPI001BD575CA|nr:hypothetical protein [Glaciihabitans sp. dw_435]
MANADAFPPYPFDIAGSRYAEHRAWWASDMATIEQIYSGKTRATHIHQGRPHRGGVVGNLSKMFWGKPIAEGEDRVRLHLPLPADVAQKSASILFGEAPKFELPDSDSKNVKAQERLMTLMSSDESHAELLKSGEYASSLGGAYLAPAWDAEVADHVFPKAYRADVALPVFRHGRLASVKLWTEYQQDDGRAVFRLIEEHPGPGLIRFTLYEGGVGTLGRAVPVDTLEETAHIARLKSPVEYLRLATEGQYTISIATGIDEMAVAYYPNMMPNPDWEQFGALASVGRSDYLGLEPVFDKTDQLWSSLFRDVENGAGRVTLPESYLEPGARGQGPTFDPDRTYYKGINTLGAAADSLKSQMLISQFDIRDDVHLNIIDALERRVLRTIGLSPKEFGKSNMASGAKTATEVTDDRAETEATRDVKGIYARPALAKNARVCLAIDGVVFPGKGGGEFGTPTIGFAKISQEDPEKRARTLQYLDAARSIATEDRVRYRLEGEDVTEAEIRLQIERAEAELGTLAPDPATFTGDDDPAKETE